MDTTTERIRGGGKHGRGNDNPRAVALTRRDLMIFLELYRNRLMHTGQLQALYGDKMDDRLRRLFDAGYIDWPEVQKMWRHPGIGSRPNVWALGNRGAWALVAEGHITEARAKDWNENNRRLKRSSLFLPHTLAVNDLKVAFRVACMRRGLTYIPGERLVRNRLARALDIPGRCRPLMTDDTFAIAREGKEPALFFVEESWLSKFGQADEWSFCLRAARMAREQ